MATENPAQGAFPDPQGFARYRTAIIECKKLASRLYPKVQYMFPGGLNEMIQIDPSFQSPECPFPEKAKAQEDHLAFLRELWDMHNNGTAPDPPPPSAPPSAPSPSRESPQTASLPASKALIREAESFQSDYFAQHGRSTKRRDRRRFVVQTARDPPSPDMYPEMPAAFAKGRYKTDRDGIPRTDAKEFWNFCFEIMYVRSQALGGPELNKAFYEWQQRTGRPITVGHERWWTHCRELHFRLFERVGVKIETEGLKRSLQYFWKEHARQVLDLLCVWIKSAAAQALQSDKLLAAAVVYIRTASEWWPDHGPDLDARCMTKGVVTEERLVQEWTSAKESDTDHAFFAPEYNECCREIQRKRQAVLISEDNPGAHQLLYFVAVDVQPCLQRAPPNRFRLFGMHQDLHLHRTRMLRPLSRNV